MNSFFRILLLIIIFTSCKTVTKTATSTGGKYPGVDYVKVGELSQTLAQPYIFHLKNWEKKKELVLIGTEHTNDPKHIEFKVIELYFSNLVPQVAFNEGGQVADSIHFKTSDEAIIDERETGYLKFLCDKWGIQMLNGDLTAREEFPLMLEKYSQEELFLYYTIERLVYPYQNGFKGNMSLQEAYSNFINNYLTKHNFPITSQHKDFTYFEKLYQKHLGKPFDLATYDYSQFNFLVDNGKFTEIGRASKVVRDNALLSKIEEAFKHYDRIFVIFGGAHALAIEPALLQIMQKKE